MANWDFETDYLVVGSGAAGMSAAITAHRNGLDTIIIESMPTWGGTTAISGGGLWMPGNPLSIRAGVNDSPATTFDYMNEVIKNPGPWANDARKWAFIHGIPKFFDMMEEEGIRWMHTTVYPDYYPDLKSGRIGRSIEVKPFNYRKLGSWRKTVTKGGIPIALTTDDVWLLSRAFSTWSGFKRGVKITFRILGKLLSAQDSRGMGYAYAGSLMYIVQQRDIPVWLNSPLTDLIVEDGRVVGAQVSKDGHPVNVKARRGVMLAAGGFAHNTEKRLQYQGVPGWSASPKGQNGDGIWLGEKIGGELAMMEDAWWGAVVQPPKNAAVGFILWERSHPFSLIVDQNGRRFMNESESYVDIGHDMLDHYREKGPEEKYAWLIWDKRHEKRYLNSTLLTGKKPYFEQGILFKAKSLEALAAKISVDIDTLKKTVQRFNGFTEDGVDRDFERGRTEYDRYYSDPRVKPNPNLGPLEKGPFWAIKIQPGDLNTKGGLVTDEYARVLRDDGSVIAGLYAAGNNSASVMGHTYPGAGSTIAPASVFGYIGALHASQREQDPNQTPRWY
jgi:3-oxosteroid 1-dehydrogenase